MGLAGHCCGLARWASWDGGGGHCVAQQQGAKIRHQRTVDHDQTYDAAIVRNDGDDVSPYYP